VSRLPNRRLVVSQVTEVAVDALRSSQLNRTSGDGQTRPARFMENLRYGRSHDRAMTDRPQVSPFAEEALRIVRETCGHGVLARSETGQNMVSLTLKEFVAWR
jgi:hypothetical protein